MILKDLLDGLVIFNKYIDSESEFIECEHDVAYLVDSDTKISEEDLEKLEELGFFIDEESECWSFFA